nr:MAG TPA: hypothetical protein [Caudoviricetes sp.]
MRLKSFMCRREQKTHGAILASVIMMVYNKQVNHHCLTHIITQHLTRLCGFFFAINAMV